MKKYLLLLPLVPLFLLLMSCTKQTPGPTLTVETTYFQPGPACPPDFKIQSVDSVLYIQQMEESDLEEYKAVLKQTHDESIDLRRIEALTTEDQSWRKYQLAMIAFEASHYPRVQIKE